MDSLLDRFLRYVKVDTKANEMGTTYPSSPGQKVLAGMLAEELATIGCKDIELDQYSIVTATVPATTKKELPAIAWFAHVDTSPEFSGKDVKPIVHRNYAVGDIALPGDARQVLTVAQNPELLKCIGKTVITTDGTTLLGADDKAGVAVIMTAAAWLLQNPSVEHGPIRICFTCDEEIGHGVDHIDLKKINAVAGYTLDGLGEGEIENETFSADKAEVKISGINIHPSIAKGRMVNAIKVTAAFLDRLPRFSLSPETTDKRDGFVHPYGIEGGVPEVNLRFLLRDFVTSKLREEEALLRQVAKETEAAFPGSQITINIVKQYRNLADGLAKEPRALPFAIEAMQAVGLKPNLSSCRGGTDGSRLTEIGLPTPNLSTGEHNPHSPLEWTCLEEMETAVKVLVELAKRWSK